MRTVRRLPDHYAITPAPDVWNDRQFLSKFERLCASGIRHILLRAPLLSTPDYLALAACVSPMARRFKCRLMLHNCIRALSTLIRRADNIYFSGIHLSQSCARTYTRRPVGDDMCLAVSCHNLDEVRHAERITADFCVLGPVCRTATHPQGEVLGQTMFGHIASRGRLPIYALGGMTLRSSATYRRAGAQGIAGIRCFWPSA